MFSGKVALITGASSGIGRAIAIDFASKGCLLTLTGRDEVNLELTKRQCVEKGLAPESILLIRADAMAEEENKIIEETIEYFNKLDILVNNAGIFRSGPIDGANSESDYNELMQVNVHSPVRLTRLAVPHLEKTRGRIVNISSVNALRPFANLWAHCMTKACMDQFARCLAIELAPRGIRINNVSPGVIKTPILSRLGKTEAEIEAFFEHSRSTHALQRVATVEEVAGVVAFLVSDKSGQTTGTCVLVDGGKGQMCQPIPPD